MTDHTAKVNGKIFTMVGDPKKAPIEKIQNSGRKNIEAFRALGPVLVAKFGTDPSKGEWFASTRDACAILGHNVFQGGINFYGYP